jgi:type VI protein secretion system component Hcp
MANNTSLDGFLELIKQGKPVEGETLDRIFTKKKASSIASFSMEGEDNESPADEDSDADSTTQQPLPQPGQGPLQFRQPSASTAPTTAPVQAAKKEKKKYPITFKVTKEIDQASPELYLAYCKNADLLTSQPFDTAKVTLRKAGGKNKLVYLVLEFSKVRVKSYSVSAEGEKLPVETVNFNCTAVKLQYRSQRLKGLASAQITGWDFDADTQIDS